MRERLEIKEELWKQHRRRSEMSCKGNKMRTEISESDFSEEQGRNLTTLNISTTFSPG